jgi:hypothetical protein
MDEDLIRAGKAYAARYSLRLSKRLGFGIHGIVFVARSKLRPGRSALKLHRDSIAYEQEKLVYQRLMERSLHRILGFHIPTIIRFDDELLGIEMTIVKPPFVLDFAGVLLGATGGTLRSDATGISVFRLAAAYVDLTSIGVFTS